MSTAQIEDEIEAVSADEMNAKLAANENLNKSNLARDTIIKECEDLKQSQAKQIEELNSGILMYLDILTAHKEAVRDQLLSLHQTFEQHKQNLEKTQFP